MRCGLTQRPCTQTRLDMSRSKHMMTSGIRRRCMTSLLLFIALCRVASCEGDSASCTPDCCNYTAPERLLDCRQLGCSSLQNFSSWNIPVDTFIVRGNNISHVTSLGSICLSLQQLDLSDNLISDIDHAAFRGCNNLSVINFDCNQLRVDIFFDPSRNPLFGLRSLSHLSLASNHIGNLISEPFSAEIHTLQFLNLSDNGIKLIEHNSLTDLIHLKTLDLSANQIKTLDSQVFRGLRALVYLDLSRNRLSHLPADLFADCTKLEELDLSQNLIATVDREAFNGLSSLKSLCLNSNLLTSFPASLPSSLQHLFFDNNPNLVNLKSSSPLGPELTSLSISNCEFLREIGPASLSNLPRLQSVRITGNCRLATVSSDAFGGPNSSVAWLNLSYNALTSLDDGLLDWRSVSGADLSGNAWNCDCHMDWMRHSTLNLSLLHTVVCSEPVHLRGRSLASVDPKTKLECSPTLRRYRREMVISLIAAITALIILVFVLLAVRPRRTVLPRWFNKYETLHGAAEVSFDSVEAVNIVHASSNTLQLAAAAAAENSPTPV